MRNTELTGGDAAVVEVPIHPCEEARVVLAVINAGAAAYRGVIPTDCCHEPYMSEAELRAEIAAGVEFVGCELDAVTVGVMGIQSVRNVDLIRHAYVLPAYQGRGLGGALLRHLRARKARPILVGTWSAASWAIAFYEKHGFRPVPGAAREALLKAYWTVPDRQIAASVVLSDPSLTLREAAGLIQRSSPDISI